MLPKDHPKWHPLQKIQSAINIGLKNLAAGWILGERICADKNMIKYMGKFVLFAQYMPAKPIKHGIKYTLYVVPTQVIYTCSKYTPENEVYCMACQRESFLGCCMEQGPQAVLAIF
jgi:hypothetical protein